MRITTIKRLSNNLKTVLKRTVVILPKLNQEFSKFQIQTANIMISEISKMLAIGRQDKENDDEVEASVGGQEIYEVKVHELVMSLRNPLQSRKDQKTFLTTAVIKGVSIRNYVEQAFNWKPVSKDSLRQAYLDDRYKWVSRINEMYTRRKPPSAFRKRMRQSITFIAVKSLTLTASPSAANNRFSGAPASQGEAQPITLLASNFAKYGLPEDTPLCNIVHTSYYLVKEEEKATAAATAAPAAAKANKTVEELRKSDFAANTPRTPSREQARYVGPLPHRH